MKKALVCSVCGHILLTNSIPVVCPIFYSSTTIFILFVQYTSSLHTKEDVAVVGETEKKHLPVVKIVDIENGYKNIYVTVGEIEHPMVKEHFISKISIYIDNELVSMTLLTKDLKPETNIKVKTDSKNISVVAQCNIHGSWITSIQNNSNEEVDGQKKEELKKTIPCYQNKVVEHKFIKNNGEQK